MANNQFKGREETNKKDFGKLTIEEQKQLSKEKINDAEQDPSNEGIAQEAAKQKDEERSKHLH